MSPSRLPRACRFPGCPYPAISRGRCAQHAHADEAQRHRFGRGVYHTSEWRRLSREHLLQHPFCICGCGRVAELVDHRIPHRGDPALAFDRNNLQSMTRQCHGRKTASEVQR